MPSYPLPPWIQAPDMAGQAARGFQMGAQIQMEQNRLAQESQRMAAQMAAQQQQQQVENARAQQQLEMTKAYHNQQYQLRAAQLAETKQRVDLATKMAANRTAAQQEYQKRIAFGEDPGKVLMSLGPSMGMSGAGMASLARPHGAAATWFPANPQTGAPGHFESPSGGVHIPTSAREPGALGQRDILRELMHRRDALEKGTALKFPPTDKTPPAMRQQYDAAKKQLDTVQAQIDQMIAGAKTKPGGNLAALDPSGGLGANEVLRYAADGRPAVFDKATKKFLRYADADSSDTGE